MRNTNARMQGGGGDNRNTTMLNCKEESETIISKLWAFSSVPVDMRKGGPGEDLSDTGRAPGTHRGDWLGTIAVVCSGLTGHSGVGPLTPAQSPFVRPESIVNKLYLFFC